MPIRGRPLQFTGENYLKHHALPNFYFHVTTAYDLLRHNGVQSAEPTSLVVRDVDHRRRFARSQRVRAAGWRFRPVDN